MKSLRVLIFDPNPNSQRRCASAFDRFPSADVACERDQGAALDRLKTGAFDLFVAAAAQNGDVLHLLDAARRIDRNLPVIVVAESPSLEQATNSFRAGAGDYLDKAQEPTALAAAAERLLGAGKLQAEYELLRRQVERPYSFDDIIGGSKGMQKVFSTIEQVAQSNVDVLVVGETGTGKELVARAIHRRSARASAPFVPVDCGAIPDNLLESELFGHERGAFTGADARRIGLLEFADGGTLFLDELGELPLPMQAKLLRTLQERKIRRVGGREEIDVNVRIVAATARPLDQMVRDGTFRQDLFYRINVVRIDLPPLRERGDDIGLLAEHLANRYGREMGKNVRGITPEAYQVLAQYRWPGNVRELQNVIRRGIALTRESMIGLEDLPDDVVASAGEIGAADSQGYFAKRDQYLAQFERAYLEELLTRHAGDVRTAAKEAHLPRGTLYRLMKKYGLDSGRFR